MSKNRQKIDPKAQAPQGRVRMGVAGRSYKLMNQQQTQPRTDGERWRMMFEHGLMEMSKGEDAQALAYFEPLWAQNPTGKRRDELCRWLGLARWGATYGREATPLLEETYKKSPWDKDVATYLVSALQNTGRIEDAEKVARNLYEMDKKEPRFISLLTEVLNRGKKFDEATKIIYDSQQTTGPQSVRLALAFSATAMKSSQEQKAIDWLLREVDGLGVNDKMKVAAHFQLGDLYDKIGEYDKAFKYYNLGNNAIEGSFTMERSVRKRNSAAEIWTAERIKRLREHGNPDARPVLICGMPRSGTTLTEQVLGRHEDIFPAGELRAVKSIPEKIQKMFLGKISSHTIISAFDSLTPGQIKRAAQIYLDHIEKLAGPDYSRVIDKMPGNIWHVGMFAALLPNARIIFSRRDPRDVVLSCYFRHFRADHPYSTDLLSCAQYCREVFLMADHWMETLQEVDSSQQIMIASTYENLVSDPQKYGKQLYDHIGMEWDDSMVDIDKESRNVNTLRTDQIGRKIDTKSKERWRRYEKYVRPIEEGLGDLLPYIP